MNKETRLNADLYQLNHSMQRKINCDILERYKLKINWKNAEKILDIGCGPGDFTVDCLLPLAPANAELTGMDISSDMIKLAKTRYNDPRFKFIVGDISDLDIGKILKESYNTVFSFFCFHWIENQEAALKNIYDVLLPGGEMLLVFVGSCPLIVIDNVSKREKWSPYIQGELYAMLYRNTAEKHLEMEKLFLDVGFDIEECSRLPVSYVFPSEESFHQTCESLIPLVSQIPEALRKEYLDECKNEISSNKLYRVSDENGKFFLNYEMVAVLAKKPVHIS